MAAIEKSFTVEGNHTKPVTAGTVVTFSASMQEDIHQYHLTWIIQGPYSNTRTEYPDQQKHFNWDTSGFKPGRYKVYCRRRRTGPVTPEAAEQTQDDQSKKDSRGAEFFGRTEQRPAEEEHAGQQEEHGFDDDYEALEADPDVSKAWDLFVEAGISTGASGAVPISLQRTAVEPTESQFLWMVIRNRTNAIGFKRYLQFTDSVMCGHAINREGRIVPKKINFRGTDAYDLLRSQTEAFLMHEAGVLDPSETLESIREDLSDPARQLRFQIEEKRRLGKTTVLEDLERFRDMYYGALGSEVLPYMALIQSKLRDLPLKEPCDVPVLGYGILKSKLSGPLAIELIWSYWHEEAMLAQSLNAIAARFENRKPAGDRPDPLARMDLDPLRPLNNLLWGWIQDDCHRLSVRRRAFEYDHEYGLRLVGRAIPDAPSADSRTKFLASFHTLLNLAHVFFKEDDDTTVIADGFPLLNALRETHLLLAEGAHNQFGDLPTAARAEMLIMQWMMARPEMREFIGGRIMVPYEEEWMDRVDTMKSLQGWTNVSVTHFRDMAVFGERLLLSIRYGNWTVINDPQEAANWARYWRAEIQRYTHAYRSATGADQTEWVDSTMPGLLLRQQMAEGR
jgi:hypothetical protein